MPPEAELKFVSGPAAGRSVRLGPSDPVSFGRGDEATVRLEDNRVSRIHFRIEVQGDVFILVDLKSTNGTLLNGIPVERQRLYHEDVIRAGAIELQFLSVEHVRPGATTHVLSAGRDGRIESTYSKVSEEIIQDLVARAGKGSEGVFLKLLYGISNLSSRETNAWRLAEEALRLLCQTLKAQRGMIVDRDLQPIAAVPGGPWNEEILRPPLRRVLEDTVRKGVSLNNALQAGGSAPPGPVYARYETVKTVFVLCAPLRGAEGPIGAVYVDKMEVGIAPDGAAFGEEDLFILALIGRHLGLALDHARIVHEKFLSEERYRLLVEEANDAIFLLDAGGRFTFVNSRALPVFGRPREALIGHEILELVPAELREGIQGRIAQVGGEGKGQALEADMIGEKGDRFTASLSLAPLKDPGGSLVGLLGVGRDVTRERKLQEALRQSERLASLGQLVAGIGHEINNPLTTIIGFSQLLLRDPGLPLAVRQRLELVFKEGERAKAIIGNLLTFARPPRSGKSPVDVNQAISQTLTLLGHDVQKSKAEVMTFLEEIPAVLGDASQLMEVFMNVILNGLQALEGFRKDGRIVIKTWKIENEVHVSIADNGPGIPPENLARIFDPFFTTKEVGKGTGLGLSIVYRILAALDGRISADSTPGEGATFEIVLPASSEMAAPPPREETPLPAPPLGNGS
jgi:PAS domain S-box-containing protein